MKPDRFLADSLLLGTGSDAKSATLIKSINLHQDVVRVYPTDTMGENVKELEFDVSDLGSDSLEQQRWSQDVVRKVFEEWLGVVFITVEGKQGLMSSTSHLLRPANDTLPSPFTDEITRICSSENDLLVFGRSATGKTVASIQAANNLANRGYLVQWLDLSEPERSIDDLLIFMLASPNNQHLHVFVDDGQVNPRILADIARLQRACSCLEALKFNVCVLGWASARSTIMRQWPKAVTLDVRHDPILPKLVANRLRVPFSVAEREQIAHIANGDLIAAQLIVSFINREQRFPTASELGKEAVYSLVAPSKIEKDKAEILYRVASLSQFEIDTSIPFLARISVDELNDLISRNALRKTGDYVSIGHRSSARFILSGLTELFPRLVEQMQSPTKLAVEYLRSSEPGQLVSTLERLDVLRFQSARHNQHGTKFLTDLWQTLRKLLLSLSREGSRDPTWSNDTGSATFALRILSEFGYESWSATLAAQRNRWQLDPAANTLHLMPPEPNERKDFMEIKKCMLEEESTWDLPNHAEHANKINFDQMHRTWAFGLLLGQEAAAVPVSTERINALKQIIASEQLPNGSFYPARVPWVTARVLIGLTQTGETVNSSEVVRNACDWLLSETPEGPCSFGSWNSWTGSWNTTLGTTAMCLNALLRSGVSIEEPTLDLAIQYLLDSRGEWAQSGQEIDCAFALETLLLANFGWREFEKELETVKRWAQDPRIWSNVVLDASQVKDESLKIPFVTSSLVGVIWYIVRSELPLLLEDLAVGTYLPTYGEVGDPQRSLRMIQQRLDEIRRKLRSGIEQRLILLSKASPVGVDEIRSKLRDLRSMSLRCEEAVTRVQALSVQGRGTQQRQSSIKTLKIATNDLGFEVFGRAWESLE